MTYIDWLDKMTIIQIINELDGNGIVITEDDEYICNVLKEIGINPKAKVKLHEYKLEETR